MTPASASCRSCRLSSVRTLPERESGTRFIAPPYQAFLAKPFPFAPVSGDGSIFTCARHHVFGCAHDRWPRSPDRLSAPVGHRSEEHTSELQSLMRISYAVFCLNKKKKHIDT